MNLNLTFQVPRTLQSIFNCYQLEAIDSLPRVCQRQKRLDKDSQFLCRQQREVGRSGLLPQRHLPFMTTRPTFSYRSSRTFLKGVFHWILHNQVGRHQYRYQVQVGQYIGTALSIRNFSSKSQRAFEPPES
jgi:hypothetical protein